MFFLKKRFILISIFAFFSLSSNTHALERIYDRDLPNEITIILKKGQIKEYFKYLEQINNDLVEGNIQNINPKFKKYLRWNGEVSYKDSRRFNISGKLRITGDLVDHVSYGRKISSIKIILKNSNLGGVTRFRLLLPETRNPKTDPKGKLVEIAWSLLMEELGYPTPFRQLINVNLNGKKYIAIFEEEPEKEFLESFGLRETPVVSVDEKQLYSNFWQGLPNKFGKLKLRIENNNFLKNNVAREITLSALNPSFLNQLSSTSKVRITKENKNLLVINWKNSSKYQYDLLNLYFGSHGLVSNNRKFIFDGISKSYIPIYFDGNTWAGLGRKLNGQIIRLKCDNEYEFLRSNKNLNTLVQTYLIKLQNRNLNKPINGQVFSVDGKAVSIKCFAAYIFRNFKKFNVPDINPKNEGVYDLRKPALDFNNINSDWIQPQASYDFKRKEVKTCLFIKENNFKERCNISDEVKYFDKLLSGDTKPIKIDGKKLHIHFNPKTATMPKYVEKYKEFNLINKNFTINIPDKETHFFKLELNNSNLNINLLGKNSKIVFFKSNFVNSKLNIQSNPQIDISSKDYQINSRYDSRLLTACSTIMDSTIKKTFIKTDGCFLEDGINFIRTFGENVSLNVKNSMFDGLDADFSTISFKKVEVSNSGNDCIDLSGGTYHFKNSKLQDCGDKALSVGEKSRVVVNKLNIKSSDIGVASKDSSEVNISNLIHQNTRFCTSVYQKKQEFGPAIIRLPKINDCNHKIENNSKIFYENICKTVKNNYFFNSCITKDKVILELKKPIPENAILFVNKFIMKNEKSVTLNHKCSKVKLCSLSFDKIITNKISVNLIKGNVSLISDHYLIKDFL